MSRFSLPSSDSSDSSLGDGVNLEASSVEHENVRRLYTYSVFMRSELAALRRHLANGGSRSAVRRHILERDILGWIRELALLILSARLDITGRETPDTIAEKQTDHLLEMTREMMAELVSHFADVQLREMGLTATHPGKLMIVYEYCKDRETAAVFDFERRHWKRFADVAGDKLRRFEGELEMKRREGEKEGDKVGDQEGDDQDDEDADKVGDQDADTVRDQDSDKVGDQDADKVGDQEEDKIRDQEEDDQDEDKVGDQDADEDEDQDADKVGDREGDTQGDQEADKIEDQDADKVRDQDADKIEGRDADKVRDQDADKVEDEEGVKQGDQSEDHDENQDGDKDGDEAKDQEGDQEGKQDGDQDEDQEGGQGDQNGGGNHHGGRSGTQESELMELIQRTQPLGMSADTQELLTNWGEYVDICLGDTPIDLAHQTAIDRLDTLWLRMLPALSQWQQKYAWDPTFFPPNSTIHDPYDNDVGERLDLHEYLSFPTEWFARQFLQVVVETQFLVGQIRVIGTSSVGTPGVSSHQIYPANVPSNSSASSSGRGDGGGGGGRGNGGGGGGGGGGNDRSSVLGPYDHLFRYFIAAARGG